MNIRDPKILRIRIPHGELFAMGPGKAELLQAIDETGSISAAGRKLGISYRKAWLLVEEMNQCFRAPVVETAAGGSGGGGAHLSPLGRKALEHYLVMMDHAQTAILDDLKSYRRLLGTRPKETA